MSSDAIPPSLKRGSSIDIVPQLGMALPFLISFLLSFLPVSILLPSLLVGRSSSSLGQSSRGLLSPLPSPLLFEARSRKGLHVTGIAFSGKTGQDRDKVLRYSAAPWYRYRTVILALIVTIFRALHRPASVKNAEIVVISSTAGRESPSASNTL